MAYLGKKTIKSTTKSTRVEELDLSDVSDDLYECIITSVLDDLIVRFWGRNIHIYHEFDKTPDKHKRSINLSEVAIEDVQDQDVPSLLKDTIVALKECLQIYENALAKIEEKNRCKIHG